MRLNSILLLFCIVTVVDSKSQSNDFIPTLTIGDPAPPLRVQTWFKGAPVKSFEKGKIYVVEFWATWCIPCKAAMPRLSVLARKYYNDVTFIGIDVKETKPKKLVQGFVDSMGDRLDYLVAGEDSNYMDKAWLQASGEPGIPETFVVDKQGQIAWIGDPHFLDKVLQEVVNGTWNTIEARAKQKSDRELSRLDKEAMHDLAAYAPNALDPNDQGKPDSILARINFLTAHEPRLTFTTAVGHATYAALLKTQPAKAYEYGRKLINTSTGSLPALDIITDVLESLSSSLVLPAEIYLLGAEALEMQIAEFPYPEIINIGKRYDQVAEWYWKAGEQLKAIITQQKAIDELKLRGHFSAEELKGYEFRLKQYKRVN